MPRGLRLDVAITLLVLAALALAPLLGFGANHYLTLFARIMILAAAAVSLSFLVGGGQNHDARKQGQVIIGAKAQQRCQRQRGQHE